MVIIPKSIQDSMLADAVKYNIRLHFPNAERTDICNNQIVEGSAKFTESLCSQDTLEFGLCESPTFECETVGVGNITGCKIELTYEVICDANTSGAEFRTDLQSFVFPIQKGVFVVASAERQADMQHRKIVAYGGGAATDWALPSTETIKYYYFGKRSNTFTTDMCKVALSKLNLDNFPQSEFISSRNESIRDWEYSQNVNVRFFVYDIYIPLKFEKLISYDYAYIQTVDSAIGKLIDGYREKIGDLPERAIKELIAYGESAKKGAYVSYTGGSTPSYRGYLNGQKYLYINQNIDNDTAFRGRIRIPCALQLFLVNDEHSVKEYLIDIDSIKTNQVDYDFPSYIVTGKPKELMEYDLQNLVSNMIEMQGLFAKIDSNNALKMVSINKQFNLLPNNDLLPSENLKPLGIVGASIIKSMYSSLWYQEDYTKPYGAVYCAYKDKSGADAELTIYVNNSYKSADISTYQIYNLSDNEFIKYNQYTEAQIEDLLQRVVASVKDISYVPVKLQCVSIPFVESGDTLEILTQNNDSITTIVLKRTLSGESYITDEFTSV